MSSTHDQFRAHLLADPSLFPHKIELITGRVLLLRMSPQDYARASFLDDRILSPQSQGQWVTIGQIGDALLGVEPARPLHFIFHAGHVGSTLISRLLEGAGGILGLREPLPLRTLAEAHDTLDGPASLLSPADFTTLLNQQCLLWRRGFADTRAVVLKATSGTARLGPALLANDPGARALYLNLPLEPYLTTLLAGQNTALDTRGFAAERMRRIIRFGATPETPLYAMSPGELAAMTWTAERLTQQALTAACGSRVLSMDFNDFLADVSGGLRAICAHFAISAPEPYFTNANQHPPLTRYAKAPEHAYTPADRAEILREAGARLGGEIRRGLDWVDALAKRSPAVAAITSG